MSKAMNAQTEITEAQRQFDNKLLRLIQQHFPSIPLHGEEADKNWTRWLNFARDCARLTKPDAGGGEASGYVACRQCDSCNHIGINDDADDKAACNNCDWRGASPEEDVCPECGDKDVMMIACPECGGVYSLLAETGIRTSPMPPPSDVPAEPDHIADAGIMVSQTSAVPMPEPFGYFRCTLDGWIDCAETDEGARPLYEASQLDARVSEETRELVDGLQQAKNALDILWLSHHANRTDAAIEKCNELIAKHTQTQEAAR